MRTTAKSRDLADRMEKQRAADRSAQRRLMRGRQFMLAGVNADHIYGVDEGGRRVDLKVNTYGWNVLLEFRRERASIDEGFMEGSHIPSATVASTTDIYHAVRAMKHIREEYPRELERNEALCKNIDELHAMLYIKGDKFDDKRLGEIRGMLAAYDAEAAGSGSVQKQLASRKMDDVLARIDEAMGRTGFKKRTNITAACALLTSFKTRYLRREGQVAGINLYDQVREDGLRAIRDRRLKGVLSNLARKLEGEEGLGVACTLISDRVMISAMRVAKEKVSRGKHDEALRIIRVCIDALKGDWFKRQLQPAHDFVRSRKDAGGSGWREEARGMLESFARLLGQRNTRYILDELKKTNDAYLQGEGKTIAWMEYGNAKIREALVGEPLRNALAWVDELKSEAAGTELESLHRKLILRNGQPKDMATIRELLKEAGRAYEHAAIALVS